MGVFTKHWKKKEEPKPVQVIKADAPAQQKSVRRCFLQHAWGEKVLSVNSDVHEVQHPEHIGKPCDCGKFLWNEGMCGCPGQKHWEAKMVENPNYVG